MFDEVFVHMAYAPSESSMLIRLYTNGDASAAAKVLDRIRLLLITELTMFSNLKGKILVPMLDKVTDCNLDDMAKQTDKHCILDLEYVTYPKIYAWVLKDVKKHAVPKPYKHPHGAITWVKLDKPMSAESVVDDSPLPMPEGSVPTALYMLELKAQESIVRGQVGWSQQSSESSRPLTISGAYDPADFTDCRGFHRGLHRWSLGNLYFEVFFEFIGVFLGFLVKY